MDLSSLRWLVLYKLLKLIIWKYTSIKLSLYPIYIRPWITNFYLLKFTGKGCMYCFDGITDGASALCKKADKKIISIAFLFQILLQLPSKSRFACTVFRTFNRSSQINILKHVMLASSRWQLHASMASRQI